jgi:hypothetical protein
VWVGPSTRGAATELGCVCEHDGLAPVLLSPCASKHGTQKTTRTWRHVGAAECAPRARRQMHLQRAHSSGPVFRGAASFRRVARASAPLPAQHAQHNTCRAPGAPALPAAGE